MAQIVRVFAAMPATPDVADFSFNPVPPHPIVRVTCEASQSEFAGGNAFELRGFVGDFGNNLVFPFVTASGSLNTPDTVIPSTPGWQSRNKTFTFPLPVGITGIAAAGGFVEIRVALRVGAAIPGADVDFCSTIFVWTF